MFSVFVCATNTIYFFTLIEDFKMKNHLHLNKFQIVFYCKCKHFELFICVSINERIFCK